MKADITVPGDKSISHRALMLAAIHDGVTQIKHCLVSDDCRATARALQQMGVRIEFSDTVVTVHGVGLRGLKPPQAPLDCGNSGTTMRLLSGILAGQSFESVLVGDESLSKRPMMRIVEPLRRMGASIKVSDAGHAPIKITGQPQLNAIAYTLPIASAQVKSCVLLAGLYASGETEVFESGLTRDHTERMLQFFLTHPNQNRAIEVPGDLSSAAFFMVLATLVPHAELLLRGVGVNRTRTGVIDILNAMGAKITLHNTRCYGNEPVADIQVCSASLTGIDVSHELLTRAIDEFPILMIAASMAQGKTRILGAGELRHKESDRIKAMVDGLTTLGIRVIVEGDNLEVEGGVLTGGVVDACADHRIAMAFLIANAIIKDEIQVRGTECISTSFPGFMKLLEHWV